MKILVWLILCLIWGTTWIFIKIGLVTCRPSRSRRPDFLLRSHPFCRHSDSKDSAAENGNEWQLIALTGVLQFSINYSIVFWSEQYISSGLAAVLQAMITVFGLVLAWIFLPNEKITRLKIFAVASASSASP